MDSTPEKPQPWVLAVVTDLMFQVRIRDLSKRAGREVRFVSDAKDAIHQACERPGLILVDLNATGIDTAALVTALKRDESVRDIPVAAYVSHVQTDLRLAAEQAGAAPVMARSILAERLPVLLAAI